MKKYTIIRFHAPWCGMCKAQYPIILQAVKKYGVNLVEYDASDEDASGVAVEKYGVKNLPYVVVLDGDKPIYTHAGITTLNDFDKIFKE